MGGGWVVMLEGWGGFEGVWFGEVDFVEIFKVFEECRGKDEVGGGGVFWVGWWVCAGDWGFEGEGKPIVLADIFGKIR